MVNTESDPTASVPNAMWLVGHWNLSWSWALWTRRMSHEHVWWIEAWSWGITRCGMGEGWRWDIKMTGTIWKVQMQTSYWPGRNAIESLRRKIRPSEDLGIWAWSALVSTCRSLIRKWFAANHSHLNTFSKFSHAFDGKPGAKRAKWTYLASLALALCTPCSSLSDEKSLVCGSLGWKHLVEWSTTSTRMGPWCQDAQKLVEMISDNFHVERWPLTHETIHDAYPEPPPEPPQKKFGT